MVISNQENLSSRSNNFLKDYIIPLFFFNNKFLFKFFNCLIDEIYTLYPNEPERKADSIINIIAMNEISCKLLRINLNSLSDNQF